MSKTVSGFKKITPVNGFDALNPDNARQNNYAWAMEEMGGYIYVGTGRNVFLQLYKNTQGARLPAELTPSQIDTRAEIWRYKERGCKEWELVFKAPQNITGIRFLIKYTSPSGETALYAGTVNLESQIVILKSTDGINWICLNTGIPGGSTRAMTVHNGKLYMGIEAPPSAEAIPMLFASTDPESTGWFPVTGKGASNNNPRGSVTALMSFNHHLYVATTLPGGFELWRTRKPEPELDCWKLVIDKGAGDAANEVPLTLGKFKGRLYIGAIVFPPVSSISPNFTKAFDLIRVNRYDHWELVVGSKPVIRTKPSTGRRHSPLSGKPSGFGNPTNLYCWALKEYRGTFYLGTFDWSVLIPATVLGISPSLFLNQHNNLPEETRKVMDNLLTRSGINNKGLKLDKKHMGFDLYKSHDGVHWHRITMNGLSNPFNYGARNLFVSRNGKLYLGTANPFQGCEVWVKD